MFPIHQVILKFVKFFIFWGNKNNTVNHAELAYSNPADGCSTNMSAGNKLEENLGLTTPLLRYYYSNKENN